MSHYLCKQKTEINTNMTCFPNCHRNDRRKNHLQVIRNDIRNYLRSAIITEQRCLRYESINHASVKPNNPLRIRLFGSLAIRAAEQRNLRRFVSARGGSLPLGTREGEILQCLIDKIFQICLHIYGHKTASTPYIKNNQFCLVVPLLFHFRFHFQRNAASYLLDVGIEWEFQFRLCVERGANGTSKFTKLKLGTVVLPNPKNSDFEEYKEPGDLPPISILTI